MVDQLAKSDKKSFLDFYKFSGKTSKAWRKQFYLMSKGLGTWNPANNPHMLQTSMPNLARNE